MHSICKNAFSKVLVSSVVAMMATTSLHAIPRAPCDAKPADVCCEEPKPGPFAFAFPYDGAVTCPRDFCVHAEFLALQAKQGGMEFALQDSNGIGSIPVSNGKIQGFSDSGSDWDYNYGARFGLGFIMDHDAWNVDFDWTWLDIKNRQNANISTSGGSIIPLFALGNDADTIAGPRSRAVWNASVNLLDASLGKAFHVSRYLIVNPFFGIRAGWIDQHFSQGYQNTVGQNYVHHTDNDFWGFGARAGLNSDWLIGKGWSLYGNVSSAMLFGKFDIEQHLLMPSTSGDSGDGFDTTDKHYMNVPSFDIALGLGWSKHFNRSKYLIGFKAGYEFQAFADQLNIRRYYGGNPNYPNDVVSRGDLTLNGFTFRAMLDL